MYSMKKTKAHGSPGLADKAKRDVTRPTISKQDAQLASKLKKLTGRVLDELKVPGAIPSVVIMAALADARKL